MSQNLGLNFPGIYQIVNTINGKLYGGQAQNIRIRWGNHRWHLENNSHRNKHLQNAWNKYGGDAFRFEVIEDYSYLAEPDLMVALDYAELQWLIRNQENSYNMMVVVSHGIRANHELKALFSELHTKRWSDDDYRVRTAASIAASYNKNDLRERRSTTSKAHSNKPETKVSVSEHMLQLWQDPNHQIAQSEKRKANWQDPSYVAQQRESRIASWADEEKRANRLEGLRRAAKDPEVLKRRKEGAARARAEKKARG